MTLFVVITGVIVLIGLAVAVGAVIGGERNARERRRLAATRWQLWQWEQELFAAVESDGCPSCVLLRRRTDLARDPRGRLHD